MKANVTGFCKALVNINKWKPISVSFLKFIFYSYFEEKLALMNFFVIGMGNYFSASCRELLNLCGVVMEKFEVL